jgi:hypothetical protein
MGRLGVAALITLGQRLGEFGRDLPAFAGNDAGPHLGPQFFDVLFDGDGHRRRLLTLLKDDDRQAWRDEGVEDRGSGRRSRRVGVPIFWWRPQAGIGKSGGPPVLEAFGPP